MSHEHDHANAQPTPAAATPNAAPVLTDAKPLTSAFSIHAMDCPTEEGLLRKRLTGMPGVVELGVDLMRRQLSVTHTFATADPIIEAVSSLAMVAEPVIDGAPGEHLLVEAAQARESWWPLSIAGVPHRTHGRALACRNTGSIRPARGPCRRLDPPDRFRRARWRAGVSRNGARGGRERGPPGSSSAVADHPSRWGNRAFLSSAQRGRFRQRASARAFSRRGRALNQHDGGCPPLRLLAARLALLQGTALHLGAKPLELRGFCHPAAGSRRTRWRGLPDSDHFGFDVRAGAACHGQIRFVLFEHEIDEQAGLCHHRPDDVVLLAERDQDVLDAII